MHLQGARVRLLADEMGLGKSAQAVRSTEDDPQRPVNVVCPAILAHNWKAEFAKWADVPRSVAVIGERRGVDPEKADVVVASYDRARRPEVAALLTARRRGGAVLIGDEFHYCKEPGAARTQAVVGFDTDGEGGIARPASRISLLTGTPAPNVAAELYVPLRVAGLIDCSYWEFAGRVCYIRETMHGPKASGLKNPEYVRGLLDGFMLRRTAAVELPPTDYGEIVVEPRDVSGSSVLAELRRIEPVAAGVIRAAAAAEDFDGIDTPHVSTLRRLVGLAKVGAVVDRAGDLLTSDPTAKLVLFFYHRAAIDLACSGLRDFRLVQLVGGDTDTKRDRLVKQFQNDPETRVAVCQIRAAGTGLTLTAANHLWIVEPSWTPADNDQACKRIVRIGQTRKTSVAFVTLNNSIDLAVNNVLRRKRNLIDKILAG